MIWFNTLALICFLFIYLFIFISSKSCINNFKIFIMTAQKISSYHRSNYVLSLISIISLVKNLRFKLLIFLTKIFHLFFVKKIISFSIFLTNVLLLTSNPQYIAFNEFSATGKYPAIFYYVSIILLAISIGQFVCSIFGLWSTRDLLNNFNSQTKCMIRLVCNFKF